MFSPTLDRRTVAAALRDLGHEKPEVRAAAARDLAHSEPTHREASATALVCALDDEHPLVRTSAAEALAELRFPEAIDALLDVAENDLLEVRQQAWLALGALGSPKALAALGRALHDPEPAIRFQAVMAVARCAPRGRALASLLAATEDDDPLVCHIALRMAEELGDETLPVDRALLERCAALLEHEAAVVRIAAAVIRGRAGLRDGAGVLLGVVRGDLVTPQAEDEAAAIELTGELGLNEAKVALRRRASSGAFGVGGDPFAWQARVALARLGDERARARILGELGSWSGERRTLAAAAAGRARLVEARSRLEELRGKAQRTELEAVEQALRELDAP